LGNRAACSISACSRCIFSETLRSFFISGTIRPVRRHSSSINAAIRRRRVSIRSASAMACLRFFNVPVVPTQRLDGLPVLLVQLKQLLDRRQVRGDPLGQLVLGVLVQRGDPQRPVERQVAAAHALERRHRLRHDVVALKAAPPEDHPRGLDLLGQPDLLLPRQQRDGAHLGEVHPHRIVDPPRTRLGLRLVQVPLDRVRVHALGLGHIPLRLLVVERPVEPVPARQPSHLARLDRHAVLVVRRVDRHPQPLAVAQMLAAGHRHRPETAAQRGHQRDRLPGLGRAERTGTELHLVDQLHARDIQPRQQVVDAPPLDHVVGQRVVQLFKAEPTPAPAERDQFFHSRVQH
jgi:hypothetical protein